MLQFFAAFLLSRARSSARPSDSMRQAAAAATACDSSSGFRGSGFLVEGPTDAQCHNLSSVQGIWLQCTEKNRPEAELRRAPNQKTVRARDLDLRLQLDLMLATCTCAWTWTCTWTCTLTLAQNCTCNV